MCKLFLHPPRNVVLWGIFCLWTVNLNAQAIEPNDWKAYFPMTVGNEWQYYKQDFRDGSRDEILHWKIVSDTTLREQKFYKLIEKKYKFDGKPISQSTTWLGYNEDYKMIVKAQFQQEPWQTWWEQLPCRLNWETSEAFFCGESFSAFHFWKKGLGVYDSTKTFYYGAFQFGPYTTLEKHFGVIQIKTSPDLDDYWSLNRSFFKVYHPQFGFIWDGNKLVNNEQERDIAESLIQLYPNPVSNKLQIKAESFIEKIVVYNLLGQVVQTKEIDLGLEISLDFSGLNSGNYLVKITLNNGGTLQKLITKN